jgi:hypothetical protein
MTKFNKLFLLASCAAVCALSCENKVEVINDEVVEPVEQVETIQPEIINISVPFPAMESANGTKVTMNPATGATQWVAGDKVVIYGRPIDMVNPTNYVTYTIQPEDIVDPTVANIAVDVSAIGSSYYCSPHHYSIAYPADDWSYYSQWSSDGRGAFSNTNQLLLGGYIADDLSSATLFNLNAAIVFKVSGDYDSYNFLGNNGEVVGYTRYVYNMNASEPKYIMKYGTATYGTLGDLTTISGPLNGDGETYNYIYIPQHHMPAGGENESEVVSLKKGFTIQFVKNGIVKGYVTSTAGIASIEPGHFIDLGTIPAVAIHTVEAIPAAEKATAVDKSEDVSANCYVVDASDADNEEKVFKFRAVKGNSYVKGSSEGTSVGAVDAVVVLWETWNNAETVTEHSVVDKVDYKDGFVYFKMPATLHAGNAVIAAKDAGGNILWSWHIWVPATTIATEDYGIHTTAMMSRNLGALIDAVASPTEAIDITSVGLLYQWGRKDPFVAPREIIEGDYPSKAKVSGVERTAEKVQISLAESIQNPTIFARGYYNGSTLENPDWCSTSDAEYWGDSGSKTIYDPCPPGYRVPKRDSGKALWASDITTQEGWSYDEAHYWFTLGNPATVFPAIGWLDGGSMKTSFRTGIWNAHSDSWVNEYGHGHIAAYARRLYIESSALKHKTSSVNKSYGYSVRCCVE